MKTLITGSKGMVARAAIEYCRSIGDDVIALSRLELDIADRDLVFSVFDKHRPEIVLNCAAYTDVDGAETNVEISYGANSLGPENLAAASKVVGARFVTVSTDYVFNGMKDGFYTQDDPPDPQSVYAASKYEGEQRAASANTDAIIVRSGWIYGIHGTNFLSVIPSLLAKGKRIAVIMDSFGTPTYAPDLAQKLRELAGLNSRGIFHITNSGPGTSFYGFAKTVADICGYDKTLIDAVSQDTLSRPAPRPRNSRLACLRSDAAGLSKMRDWRVALQDFLSRPQD